MEPTGPVAPETPSDGRKTSPEYWNEVHRTPLREGLPSRLLVPTRNTIRLLRPHVSGGSRVLEIGFAPGKILLWLAARGGAAVSGLDYSAPGVDAAGRLFASCGVRADVRCEDLFATTFPEGAFDLVYSLGVVEHFADPRDAIRRHVRLARPGGTAIVAIPNYGGAYGRLQRALDPQNLALHNLEIMSGRALLAAAPDDLLSGARAYPFGRAHAALVSVGKRMPALVAKGIAWTANGLGLLQPADWPPLCPMLVLEMRRR